MELDDNETKYNDWYFKHYDLTIWTINMNQLLKYVGGYIDHPESQLSLRKVIDKMKMS